MNLFSFFFTSLEIEVIKQKIELFSWKTTSHKDHLEVCLLPNSRLLSDLIGMWSSMKIALLGIAVFNNQENDSVSYSWTSI